MTIPESAFPITLAPGIQVLGNYYFNLFLISGKEQTVLFETGISAVADRVIAQLEGLGKRPDQIVVSHPHSDHVTGLPALRQAFPKARILAAAGASQFLAHPKAGPALVAEDAFMAQSLDHLGIRPGRPSLAAAPDLADAGVIDSPTTLDLGGGVALTLMPVLGHSPGNLVAWVENQGILFCSDSLGFHYPGRGFWPLFFTGARAYLETLEMMAALDPLIICPAHQGPIEPAAPALKLSREATLSMIQRLQQETTDDDKLAQALFDASYKDEFTLYTPANIDNCNRLLIKRARET